MGVKIEFDSTQKILLKRYLNNNGEAQKKFSKECAKAMNNYVPFETGRLKDWSIQVNQNNVTYQAEYGKKQYYTNKGNGKQGFNNGGLRGPYWDKRMWSDKGDRIVRAVAEFCGGNLK